MLALVYSAISAFAQSADRITDWSISGLRVPQNMPSRIIGLDQEGANSDGDIPNDQVLTTVFSTIDKTGAIIQFGEGTYLFEEPIVLPPNVLLRGESTTSTKLLFDLKEDSHLIVIKGGGTVGTQFGIKDVIKDSTFVAIDIDNNIAINDDIIITSEDSTLVTSSWGRHTTGQLLTINNTNPAKIKFDSPLRRSHDSGSNPVIQKIELIEGVGIESLQIQNVRQTQSQSSNIYFENAKNCWVKCVESHTTNYAHVEIRRGTNIEVSGSYFHDGFEYTAGGKAYGVMLHFTTGECLIVNNQFKNLRHSMILQAGANGNVVAYNYSIEPYWEEPGFPENSAGDIVLHGNYPYANLFEGNVAQNIVIDASHGINGPHNTFFRNRAELYGIFMDPIVISHGQNFIANEITSTTAQTGYYAIFGEGHFEQANNVLGNLIPPGGNNSTIPSSLFITDSSPSYYSATDSWPPIGYDNIVNIQKIKAQEQYQNGIHTDCELTEITTIVNTPMANNLSIFPNPTSGQLYMKGDLLSEIDYIQISNTLGQVVLVSQLQGNNIDLSHLEGGLYQLTFLSARGVLLNRKIMIQ